MLKSKQGGSVMWVSTSCSGPAHPQSGLNWLPNGKEIKIFKNKQIVQQTTNAKKK